MKSVVYDFRFQRPLFLHGLDNPPHADLTCSITLNQINSDGAFNLIKYGRGHQTEYVLEVENPLQIGFISSDQFDLVKDLRNFALAMNLALDRNCVTLHAADFVQNKSVLKPIENEPAKVTKEDGLVKIELNDSIAISDHVALAFGTQEDIDEQAVISIFKKLQGVKRFDITRATPIIASNLAKALQEFEHSMSSFDRLVIFKHLNNAIEIAANIDGSRDEGNTLDEKVSLLSGVAQTDVRLWREMYNRAKHSDTRPEQIEQFLQGKENLGQTNVKVRACAKSALLARLP